MFPGSCLRPATMAWFFALALCLALPASATPLDCSSASTLSCGTSQPYPIQNLPDWGGSVCGTVVPDCAYSIYSFSVLSDQEVQIQRSSSLSTTQLWLLNSCDSDDCVSWASGQGTGSVSACLPAGDYYVLALQGPCIYETGTIDFVSCPSCVPVITTEASWGTVKASPSGQ